MDAQPQSAADLCIVGGAGHVGLPLALAFANSGLHVRILDTNQSALDRLAAGEMPFSEQGAELELRRALRDDRLSFTSDPAAVACAPALIVTIGTPVDEFLNPDTAVMRKWVDGVLPDLVDDQLVILRSTIYPGTTDWLDRYLRERGKQVRLAFCPERIAQGLALTELRKLPQLVSGTTPAAVQSAGELFSRIAPEIIELTPLEAEFAKLFTNAYRYINFAVANQFYMLAAQQGLDFGRILHGCKHNYPRMAALPTPGFAAGPCLFKDTMQLGAFSNNQFLLGHSAMLVNEGLPAFLVQQVKQRIDLTDKVVGILGMAFKADNDDARASLSYKLKKILALEARSVLCTDPYVNDASLVPLEQVLRQSEVLFVATPHSAYRELALPAGKVVVDVWNCLPDERATRGVSEPAGARLRVV